MKTPLTVTLTLLPHNREAFVPAYKTEGSAGMDLAAAIDMPILLASGKWSLVPTGIACALPPGYEGQVRSRSGLSMNHGVVVMNAPGTIDSDYRGEIKVILMNLGQVPFVVEPGMRIAQFVVASYAHVSWDVTRDLEAEQTGRGTAGFGSTGL